MTHRSSARPCSGLRSSVLTALLGLILSGCGEDPASPTGPVLAGQPAAAVGAAASAVLTWAQISAGAYQTCGVTTDHRAWCWGEGPTGDSTTDGRLSTRPKLVAGGLQWRSVNVGTSYACGLTMDRKAYCWAATSPASCATAPGRPGSRRSRWRAAAGSGSFGPARTTLRGHAGRRHLQLGRQRLWPTGRRHRDRPAEAGPGGRRPCARAAA